MLDYCSTSGAYAVWYVYQAAITLLLLAGLGQKKVFYHSTKSKTLFIPLIWPQIYHSDGGGGEGTAIHGIYR